MMKQCLAYCKRNLSTEEFYKNSSISGGYSNYCKACSCEYARRSRLRDKGLLNSRNLRPGSMSEPLWATMEAASHPTVTSKVDDIDEQEDFKRCKGSCGKLLPRQDFHRYATSCKLCANAATSLRKRKLRDSARSWMLRTSAPKKRAYSSAFQSYQRNTSHADKTGDFQSGSLASGCSDGDGNADSLYLLTYSHDNSVIKVGRSANVQQRIKTLEACHIFRLVLLAELPGKGILESKLHEKLAYAKVCTGRGKEWFRVSFHEVLLHLTLILSAEAKKPGNTMKQS